MKKITYILMLLTSLFVLIGCVNETTLNEIKLNIDFESLDVITESDDFDASITFDAYYEVTITLNNKVSFSSELKLYINDLLIDEDEDRKSTRLNSSHVRISYAVFCLKKK